MESPEIANMRNMREHYTAERHIHERVNSIHLIAEMFDCTTHDVEIMLSLLRTHGVYEIINAVEDFTDGTPLQWSFGTVVIAAKIATLKRLYDKIDDNLHGKLATLAVSTQPSIYGATLTDAGLDEKTCMAFSDMIKHGVNIDRINTLTKAYKAQEA